MNMNRFRKINLFFCIFLLFTISNTQNTTLPNLVKVSDITNSSTTNSSQSNSSVVQTNTQVNITPSNINLNQSYIPGSSQNTSNNTSASSTTLTPQTNSISQTSNSLSYPSPIYNPQIYQIPITVQPYSNFGQPIYYTQTPSTSQLQSVCQSQQNTYWTGSRCACQVGYTNSSNNCVPPFSNTNNIMTRFARPIYLKHKFVQQYQQESSSQDQSQQQKQHNCSSNSFWNGKSCETFTNKNDKNSTWKDKNQSSNNGQSNNNTSSNSTTIVPNNTIINSNVVCNVNQTYINGQCVDISNIPSQNNTNTINCPQGQYFNSITCVDICTNGHIYNAANQSCQCPYGLVQLNGTCTLCQSNQFFLNGECIDCPQNSLFNSSSQQCVCNQGYVLQNSSCILQCQSNQYLVNGICKNCSANRQYSSDSKKCQCIQGYIQKSGKCVNTSSFPTNINNTVSSVVDGKADPQSSIQNNNSSNQTLLVYGNISMNNNNVMIILKTFKQFKFNSSSDMENFMKTSFGNNQAVPSVYCNQETNNLSLFDCLLIYPSGVPNSAFSVNFYYNYNNEQGSTTVNVDPLKYQTNSRSNLR